MPPSPTVADPRVYQLLGELPVSLFPPGLVAGVLFVERYGAEWALDLAHRLDLGEPLGRSATVPEILAERAWQPGFGPALGWVLSGLAHRGLVERVDARPEPRWLLRGQLPPADLPGRRAEGLALEPALGSTFALLDAAGRAYPAAAVSEKAGEEALLGPAGVGLWTGYFSNANPLYAFNNAIAAIAAANRLPDEGPWTLLEVGAGAGSAAEALLAVLAERDMTGRLARYTITEPSPFFRRRSQRTLTTAWPGLPLAFADLDIDRPWNAQEVEPGSLDLVFGVNVFHVAKDLAATLAQARESLRPGGWLVVGECLRPFPGQHLTAEMAFQLLPGFTDVRLDPVLRPHPGFLTPETWQGALEAAGFGEVRVVPDLGQIRELFPAFTTGAVCGRRPAEPRAV
ncbi:MAG TPA: class I SAM-dependent methyltransferase [Thermoanaerobaculia bacterium]|nr:class I SAM-dependent methyltransferase [Thermoanaerobaculia bacterium]